MTKINHFPTNDRVSKEKELLYFPHLYHHLAGPHGTFEFAHNESDWARGLQQHGVDVEVRTIAWDKKRWEWYDDKIVRWPDDNKPLWRFCIETLSCSIRGKEKEGWAYTSRADKLTYAFEQHLPGLPVFLDTYVIQDAQKFLTWFRRLNHSRYYIHRELVENCTVSVLIPIQEVLEEFPDTQRYFVFDGFFAPVTKPENLVEPITSFVPRLQAYVKKHQGNIIPLPVREGVPA